VIREPNLEVIRQAKTLQLTGNINIKLFIDFFIQEISLRDRLGKSQVGGPTIEQRYGKMLAKLATNLWEAADRLKVNPVNFTFIFLNRYYAMFTKDNPVTKMRFFFDEFLIGLSHDELLISLLNYDEAKRELVCTVIQEIREARNTVAFTKFISQHVKGYKVLFPRHDRERSKMFETVLIMLKQIEDCGQTYFLQSHAMELVKAHCWGLVQHGDPIQLHLGNFIGDTAMYRLKTYHEWSRKIGRSTATISGLQGVTF